MLDVIRTATGQPSTIRVEGPIELSGASENDVGPYNNGEQYIRNARK
jgi:hypothetical protein